MYYTKEGFKNFINNARKVGVNVVPEIDSLAHSLAFIKLFPEYAFTTYPSHVDQIDLSVPGTIDIMKQVFNEYIDGDNPDFYNDTTVHIGMDEYFGNGDVYRQYGNTLIDLMGDRTVRMWGSLSNIKGATKVQSNNVQLNIWHTMWANPKDMYNLGYGLSEYDDFIRFLDLISVISEKLWSEGNDKSYSELRKLTEIVNLSPNSNPYNQIESKTSTVLHYDFEEIDCQDNSGSKYHAVKNTASLIN